MTEKNIVFYDPRKEPFEIFGLYNPLNEGPFIRIPMDIAEKCNPGVVSNGKFTAGAPYVAGAAVEATVVKNGKGPKIHILKYKSKKDSKKKIGHRQPYTKVQIEKIVG